MKQEYAGDRLEAGIIEGHPLRVSLNQLYKWPVRLIQPTIGLAQISLRKIHSHKSGLWQRSTNFECSGTKAKSPNLFLSHESLILVRVGSYRINCW